MARGTILIADDDTAIRTVLNQALARAGYAPRATGNAATLWRWVSQGEGDVVHHRRGHARRERLRSDPAHQEDAPRPADHRHERAEHADDGADGRREGRLRVSAQALRPQRAGRRGRPRADASPGAACSAPPQEIESRGAAAHRPLAGDAGDLPRPRAPDADRPHGDDHRRERHRQGAGRARAARLRQAPPGPVRRRSTWRRSRAS